MPLRGTPDFQRNTMAVENEMQPNPGETLDSIRDVRLFQAREGYRFSVDAVLLEHFITAPRLGRGIELGTGSGIISILLARRVKQVKIVAVELQESLAERAQRNVRLNGLEESIEIIRRDIRAIRKVFPANGFDFAFSNPPFRKPDTGRMSVHEERALARHEVQITLPDLVKTAAYLLKHSGKFYLIYHPFRLTELIELLRKHRLEPKRVRFVHSSLREEAKMVLLEAVKGSGTWLKVSPPLYLHEKGNAYTDELKRILGK